HFISKAGLQYWTASAESWERTERAAKEGWFGRGQFAARFFAKRHAGFLTEFDFLTPEEFDQEPINRDFWRPQGLGSGVGTAIPIPTGENVSFLDHTRDRTRTFRTCHHPKTRRTAPASRAQRINVGALAAGAGVHRQRNPRRSRPSGAGSQRARK